MTSALAASATAIRLSLDGFDAASIMDLATVAKSGMDKFCAAMSEAKANMQRGLEMMETESRELQEQRKDFEREKYVFPHPEKQQCFMMLTALVRIVVNLTFLCRQKSVR